MPQAPSRPSTGTAVGTGISLGASAFRLVLDLGAARRGRSAGTRGLAQLVLLAMRHPHRPTVTGLEIERFPACLRIGLKIGLRIGLGLFCLGLGVGVCVGLCLWLVGRLLVGVVIVTGRLVGALGVVIRARAGDTGRVERRRRPLRSGRRNHGRRAGAAVVRRQTARQAWSA
ncbi:hypothetical protein OS121_11100 [Mycolicibacterium mucogenicum]|uniref:hypothetical protein n=1 Tax=Mycolicibacterium mucogenicum TaxID=56689 RepID=UPI0022699C21|nr:hypothetical protein [Mycolicibacterium mucogenicum]MCX8555630.1 hypothetical protein [Mycolicibacterium mucogenicum]